MPSSPLNRPLLCLFFACLLPTVAWADAFLQRVERARPPERVRLVMYYFDTCRVVISQQAVATRTLNELDAMGKRQRDPLLRRYARMLRDTYAKNLPNRTHQQNAQLFLDVANRAVNDEDEQLAGVCEHFAGQYFYLAEDYGRAFEYMLSANSRFQQVGYDQVPEIHRYLYVLAFYYYHLHEDEKVIALLTEAARYPPFSPNLHIQTYNTLAMTYVRLHTREADRQARANYQRAYKLAMSYRDSVWMGIVWGNLGDSYARQGQWQLALDAFRTDYRLVMREARTRGYPISTAIAIAEAFHGMGQLDSCRFYLEQSQRMKRLQDIRFDFIKDVQDDLIWRRYYEVARKYYRTRGNLPLVTRCTDSLLVYQARIDKRYRSRVALLAEQRLLIQKHQAEVERLREGGQTQRWWLGLGVGVGVAVLVALLLGGLYRASQRRHAQERQANAERQRQLEQENQLATAERDQARAELALLIERFGQAKSTTDLTQINLLTPDDWTEFRQRFEQVHPYFLEQLRIQFADLTPAEERLMALSKLNLDSHRMSRMLGISPESIRKSKYRMRKKWGLDGSSPLSKLLD